MSRGRVKAAFALAAGLIVVGCSGHALRQAPPSFTRATAGINQENNTIIIDRVEFYSMDADDMGSDVENVERIVRRVCDSQPKCRVEARVDWFYKLDNSFRDPATGQKKYLAIDWTCHNVKSVRMTLREGETLDIVCK